MKPNRERLESGKEVRPVLTLKGRRPVTAAATPPAAIGSMSDDDRLSAELRKLAPDVWDADSPLPLTIGVHARIHPHSDPLGISRRAVRRFLARWTSRPEYLEALSRSGAVRHDVDGREVELVTARHARRARRRMG